jgi:hypothetical protein
MRLRTFKFLFGHGCSPLGENPEICKNLSQDAFFMTASATLFGASLYLPNSIE